MAAIYSDSVHSPFSRVSVEATKDGSKLVGLACGEAGKSALVWYSPAKARRLAAELTAVADQIDADELAAAREGLALAYR